MQNFIAVDIGTTHCKTITVTEKGEVIQALKSSYPSIEKELGQHEQDPKIIFKTVIDLLLQSFSFNRQNKTGCVCFSAAMHGMMAVDENGNPLTNIITWADTRSAKYAERLLQGESSNTIYRQTGTPVHAMSPLCKIIWLRNELPELFQKTAKFISVKEYIFFRLFGKYIVDHSIASATGLFNIYEKKWSEDALNEAGIGKQHLSLPVSPVHFETGLIPQYQALFGMKNPVPFVVGGNDGCLANLGCGAIQHSEAALTIGTSGALRTVIVTPKPDAHKRTFIYLLTDNMYVTGGPTNNGGNVLEWFAKIFLGKNSNEKNLYEVIQLASGVKAGAEGLLFLPYLYGERAPVWDAGAKGCFIGLGTLHKQPHLARAVIEGICFAMFDIFESLPSKDDIGIIYASGGFIQSEYWVQMIADVFGKKIIVNEEADASAIGAAFLGMYALGILKDLNDVKRMIAPGKIFEPDLKQHSVYQKYYAVYRSLYGKLKNDFAVLHDLQNI